MKNYLPFLFCIFFALKLNAQTSHSFSFKLNGDPPPAGLTQVLDEAAKRWNSQLQIHIPIKVNLFLINFPAFPFSGLTLANGRKNFNNSPFKDILYVTALANQLAGTELNAGEYDMDIYINLATPLYFGTGKPAANQTDFMTLIMHEIGHGLGFYSDAYVNSSNVGSFGNIPQSAISPISTSFPWPGLDSVPTIYDKFVIKQSHQHLVGIAPNKSIQLGDSIKHTANYFDGPSFANASNGGLPVKLSGGNGTYTLGVDILHLNDAICNSVMSYCWGNGDTVRRPAAWEMGILKEIGWKAKDPNAIVEINNNELTMYPNPSQNYVEITGENIRWVDLYDLRGQLVLQQHNEQISNQVILNVSQLSNGVYVACMETINGRKARGRLIITH